MDVGGENLNLLLECRGYNAISANLSTTLSVPIVPD